MSGITQALFMSASAPITFTYVASSAVTAASISVPSGSQAGDLLVLWDRPIDTSVTIPTQFTLIGSVSTAASDFYTLGMGYRVMQSGDSSFTSASSRKILSAFRPSRAISLVSVLNYTTNNTGANSKSISVNGAGADSISFTALTHSTGTTDQTPSANSTLTSSFHLASGDLFLGSYYGINANITLSATDSVGGGMLLAGFTLEAS